MKASELVTLIQAKIDKDGDFELDEFCQGLLDEEDEWLISDRKVASVVIRWFTRWLTGLSYDEAP